nr:EOG090X0IKC [Ilyocryptus agilis]
MVKTKKTRGRKKYQYHANRKKASKSAKKKPNIRCQAIKNEWKCSLSASQNLKVMGLVYDANKEIPAEPKETIDKAPKPATKVVKELQAESTAPRNGTVKLPGQKVRWIEYLLDKYGEDYEAMARDSQNHYQETAAQLRQKIKQFKKRPAYLITYLRSRGLTSELEAGKS